MRTKQKVKNGKHLRETPLQVRLTPEEKRLFAHAAEHRHLTISAWLRTVAVEAARTDLAR
jgi:uncharacterized protein (DUF1778 family)